MTYNCLICHKTKSSQTKLLQRSFFPCKYCYLPWSNVNEGILNIPKSFRNVTSPSDSLESYPGPFLDWSYLAAEMQLAIPTPLADRVLGPIEYE